MREDPADAEVASHRWLVRAGYIRRVAPGVYSWLPLGLKVMQKVEGILREEMEAAGAQEVRFPALLPRDPYEATNRWTEYGENLFRLQDRRGNDMLLGPTHEEMFTLLVGDLRHDSAGKASPSPGCSIRPSSRSSTPASTPGAVGWSWSCWLGLTPTLWSSRKGRSASRWGCRCWRR